MPSVAVQMDVYVVRCREWNLFLLRRMYGWSRECVANRTVIKNGKGLGEVCYFCKKESLQCDLERFGVYRMNYEIKLGLLLHEFCRERELLEERPANGCVTIVMTTALLGAEHDLRAVLAVGVFVATIGVLGRISLAFVLLSPELEGAFGAEEVQTVVEATIATLVTADRVIRTAEVDDRDRT